MNNVENSTSLYIFININVCIHMSMHNYLYRQNSTPLLLAEPVLLVAFFRKTIFRLSSHDDVMS
jgi:hypothetical protein